MKGEKPKQYELDPQGHVWAEASYGGTDVFAYGGDYHNGPRCTVCGYGFCHHCQQMPSVACTRLIPEGD